MAPEIDEQLLLDRQSTVAWIAQANLEAREAHRAPFPPHLAQRGKRVSTLAPRSAPPLSCLRCPSRSASTSRRSASRGTTSARRHRLRSSRHPLGLVHGPS